MVKNLSCVSHGSLKRFPHTFTIGSHEVQLVYRNMTPQQDFDKKIDVFYE